MFPFFFFSSLFFFFFSFSHSINSRGKVCTCVGLFCFALSTNLGVLSCSGHGQWEHEKSLVGDGVVGVCAGVQRVCREGCSCTIIVRYTRHRSREQKKKKVRKPGMEKGHGTEGGGGGGVMHDKQYEYRRISFFLLLKGGCCGLHGANNVRVELGL